MKPNFSRQYYIIKPMILRSQRLAHVILSLGIIALLSMSFFGVFYFSMSMGGDGKMSDCPFMPGMSVCPMTPFEHASTMQGLFTNIPIQQDTFALLLAVAFIAVLGLSWIKQFLVPLELARSSGYFYRYRDRSIPRQLQELFSQGILNPKLF
jgi:hypothetical protein